MTGYNMDNLATQMTVLYQTNNSTSQKKKIPKLKNEIDFFNEISY